MNEDTNEMIVKAFSTNVTVDDGERAVTAVITTSSVDRDGEVLIPGGLDSKEFEKNPVVFFNHSYANYFVDDSGHKLPIGKCVALTRKDDQIIAKTVFATRPASYPIEKEWLPDTLFGLFQQGVLNAFSVGFIPKEMRPATDKDVEKFGAGCRRVFSKWKLFEYSVVPLPANQDAMTLAVSKGLIKADVAKRLFPTKEIEVVPVVELPIVESPPPAVQPKRFSFSEPRPDPKPVVIDDAKATATEIVKQIAKARGRVFFV